MSDRITKIKLTSEQIAQIAKDLGVNNTKRIPTEVVVKGTSQTSIDKLRIADFGRGGIGIIDLIA